MDNIEILGLIAAGLTTSAFLPQVYKTWKTKDVSSLSMPMLVLFFVGIILWLIYGIYINSLSIIIANGITIGSYALLIFFKVKYAKNKL
ncbi:MAG: SemiSWEET transporter [Bacteroidetes bacterium]|nr:SemiSWEET transporter [Bacteroidota bacterium]